VYLVAYVQGESQLAHESKLASDQNWLASQNWCDNSLIVLGVKRLSGSETGVNSLF